MDDFISLADVLPAFLCTECFGCSEKLISFLRNRLGTVRVRLRHVGQSYRSVE